jgi:hypothetical protein
MTTITPPPARPTHPFFAALNYKPAAWEEQALCRRFPNESDAWTVGKAGSDDAIEICGQCPVRTECLNAALEQELREKSLAKVFTIRGGVRATDRVRLVREIRAARAAAAKKAEEEAAAAEAAEEVAA